jgi:ketosteroid isomerase-like protein
MSQENVEFYSRGLDAINRRDLDAYLALMDDEVEAVPRMVGVEGGYHGHEGIRRWWGDLFDVFPDFAIEIVEMHAQDNLAVAELNLRGRGAGGAAPMDETVWSVARFRRGRCIWWEAFQTRAEAIEAVGLRE